MDATQVAVQHAKHQTSFFSSQKYIETFRCELGGVICEKSNRVNDNF